MASRNVRDISGAMVGRFRKAIEEASKAGEYGEFMHRPTVKAWLDEQGYVGKRPLLTLAQALAKEIEEGRGEKGDSFHLRRLLDMVQMDLEDALRVKDAVRELLFSMTETIDEIVWESPRAHTRD